MNKLHHRRVHGRDGGGCALNQERQHRTGAGSTLRRLLLGLVAGGLIFAHATDSATADDRTPLQMRRSLEHAAHDVREAAQQLQSTCDEVVASQRLQRLNTLHQHVEALLSRLHRLEGVVANLPAPSPETADSTDP